MTEGGARPRGGIVEVNWGKTGRRRTTHAYRQRRTKCKGSRLISLMLLQETSRLYGADKTLWDA
jgi:hypothetical protein